MFKSSGKKESKDIADLANKKNQIEQGTKIKGDIVTHGNIRLDGEIEGNILSESKVVLGTSCKMTGNLKAQNAEISGEVKGEIEISELLILKPTAVISGQIKSTKMVVEEGAVFNGTCNMGAVVKNIKSDNGNQQGRAEKSA